MNGSVSEMPVTFPREDDVVITLRIRTATPEDREYFFYNNNAESKLSPGFLADCFDAFDMIRHHIVSVNGRTLPELTKELRGEVEPL